MTWRRTVSCVVLAAVAATPIACGDGTPSFCEPLRSSADLKALTTALDGGDLDAAGAEARRLSDLAAEAPPEIRADFRALAESVVDIVELLAEDERVSQPQEGTGEQTVDPSNVERRREDLNDRFGDLDRRSERISTWALRECGIKLS